MIRRFRDALILELLLGTPMRTALRVAVAYAKHGAPPAQVEDRDATEDDDESEAERLRCNEWDAVLGE